jgi:hypothetical protein
MIGSIWRMPIVLPLQCSLSKHHLPGLSITKYQACCGSLTGYFRHPTPQLGVEEWRALVGTPATGGVGLTMNEADTAIFHSHHYNWEQREQAYSRNHRGGQTKLRRMADS